MKLKRLISLLLVVVMLATLAPVSVFAASGYSTVCYVYSVEAGKHGVTADNQLAYLDGTKAAATDVVPTGTTITLPTVTGFEACGASGTWTYQPTKEVTDTSLTIYYMPANVTYTVNYYFQNMSNGMPQDGYTLKGSTTFTTRSGEKVYCGQWSTLATNTEFFTGSLAEVGTLYNSGNGNYVAPTYDTDMRVAADGSTVVNLYYDCKDYYTVSYNWQGGISGPETVLVKSGSTVSPTNPVKPGYTFSGWYTDSSCSNAFSTSTAITQNTQLYAKWLPEKVMIAVWSKYNNSEDYLVDAVNAKELRNASGTVTLKENKGINASLALSGYYTYDTDSHMDEYYWKLVGKDSIYTDFDASSQSFINTLSTTVNDIDYLTSRGFHTKSTTHTCNDECYSKWRTYLCGKNDSREPYVPTTIYGSFILNNGDENMQRVWIIYYFLGGHSFKKGSLGGCDYYADTNYKAGLAKIDDYNGRIFSTEYTLNGTQYYFLYLDGNWYTVSNTNLIDASVQPETDNFSNLNWTVRIYKMSADYPICAPKANGTRVKANYAMAYSSDELDKVKYQNNGATFANINVTAVTAPSSGTCTLTLKNGSAQVGSQSCNYGTTLDNTIANTTPSVPSGYPAGSTFMGWSLSPATYNATLNPSSTLTLSSTTMQTSTMTLYAVWALPKCTITAHKADNSTVSSNATDYGWGSGKGAVESYSVSGKKLLYWYYTENSTKKVFDLRTSAVTKSLDIYPMLFESKATPSGSTTYTVNYYVMDANGNSTLAKSVGSKAGTVGATVTEVALKGSELGSSYTNYYPLNTGTNAGASKSIVLSSTASSNVINFYYVTKQNVAYTKRFQDANGNPVYDVNGKQITDSKTYYANTDTVTPTVPNITGYTATPVQATIPLYTQGLSATVKNEAVFKLTPNTYKINVECRDANTNAVLEPVDSSSKTVSGAYLSKTTINAPAVSGYFTDDDTNHPATLTDVKFDKADNTKTVTFYFDKKVSVKVEHYLQNEKRDGYPNTPIATDTDNAWHAYTLYTAEYKSYEGFTADTSKSNKATPDNNGAEIKLYYTRNTYTAEIRKDGAAITGDYILNSFAGSNTIDVQAVQTGSTGKQLSDIPGGHWEWTSSNTSVATVEVGSSDSSKATVTGKTGDNTNAKATITATYKGDNGIFATCSFVVDNTGKATFTSKIMKGTSNVTDTTQILKSFTGSKTLAVQAMQDGDSVPPGKSLSDYTGGEWVWSSSDPNIAAVKVDSSDSSKATVTGQTGSSSNTKNEEVTITAKYMVGDKEITICSFKVNNIGYVTFTPTLKYNGTVIKNGVPIGDDANIDKKTLNSYKGGSDKTATLIVTATADVEGCSLADYTDGYWTWADDSTRIDTAMRTDDGKDKTKSTAQVTGTVKNGTPTVTATFKCGSQTIVTAKVKIQNVGSKLDIQINKDAAKNCNYPDTKEIRGVNDGETLDVKVVLWQDGNVVDIDPNKIVPVSETDSTPKFTATSSKVNCFDFSRNGATGTITFKGIATKEISIKCYYNDSGIQSSDLSATATVTAYQGISSAKTYIVDYGLPLVDSEITGKIVGMTLDNIGDDVTLVTEKYPTFDKCTPGTSIEIPGWGTLAVTKPATNSGGTGEVTFTPSGFAAAATTIYYAADCSNELSDGYKYSKITIKPAATVYYEDTAVEDGGAITYAGGVDGWTTDTTSNPKATDAVADTIYGCDSRYANETGYSMNSAHKVTVNASRNDATATFDFRGTGFDIISRTGGDCGMVRVSVTNKTTNKTTKYVVDTYRGFELKNDSAKPYIEYTWKFMSDGTWHVQHVAGSENRADNGVYVDTVRDGYDIDKQTAPPTDAKEGEIFYTYTKNYKWVATTNGSALYQVPIMKITGLPLGDYTVTVSPIYSSALDRTDPKRNCFVFYLDAVRIYTGSTSTKSAEGSYAWFFNLRQELKTNVGAASISGAAIIDGLNTATTENYQDYGSNNEIYLKPDSSLTFKLTANTEPKMVLLGLKTYADDKTKSSDALKAKVEVSYKIGDEKQSTTDEITVGSAADMYYQLSNYPYNEAGTTITITNTGSTTAVLTTLKVTFSSKSGNSDVNPANSLEATTLSANSASILADEPEQDDGSDITCEITVDEQVLQDAVECIKAVMFGEIGPEVPFVPNLEVLAPEKVTVGEDITLEVTTSDDVAYITVNGVKIETNDNFVWSYTVKAEEVGEMSFEVKAYNADDKVAENNVTVAVTVEKMPFEPLINVMAPAAVTVGETITIQVATSDDVAYITVNDERVDTKDGTVWTYTTTAEAEGELSFVVVAYSEDGVAAEDEKTATVTVSQYVKSTWEIIVDAIMRYFKKLIGGN